MKDTSKKGLNLILLSLMFLMTACSTTNKESINLSETEEIPQMTEQQETTEISKPSILEEDWSEYFEGINGAAVIFHPDEQYYEIYNQELANTRRSPCSTFKIISSFIALEHNIMEPDHSIRIWSGETFWNEKWNKDIDFIEAFQTSCVWYFRELIDEIGTERMQEELDNLQYGNCDITDWAGELNTNNNNRALTGFWIESSLKISAKEQVEVMERIFGKHSNYKQQTINELEKVMRVSELDETNLSLYGKTGMGKANGIVIDSWFTGFADTTEGRIYFCVYLGETDKEAVSSAKAKEIAIKIISEEYTLL